MSEDVGAHRKPILRRQVRIRLPLHPFQYLVQLFAAEPLPACSGKEWSRFVSSFLYPRLHGFAALRRNRHYLYPAVALDAHAGNRLPVPRLTIESEQLRHAQPRPEQCCDHRMIPHTLMHPPALLHLQRPGSTQEPELILPGEAFPVAFRFLRRRPTVRRTAKWKRVHRFVRPAGEVAHTGIHATHGRLRQPLIVKKAFQERARHRDMPVTRVIMPKELVIEGEETGDIAALGLLRPARLPGYLGGVVERCKSYEVLRS